MSAKPRSALGPFRATHSSRWSTPAILTRGPRESWSCISNRCRSRHRRVSRCLPETRRGGDSPACVIPPSREAGQHIWRFKLLPPMLFVLLQYFALVKTPPPCVHMREACRDLLQPSHSAHAALSWQLAQVEGYTVAHFAVSPIILTLLEPLIATGNGLHPGGLFCCPRMLLGVRRSPRRRRDSPTQDCLEPSDSAHLSPTGARDPLMPTPQCLQIRWTATPTPRGRTPTATAGP
jgi:hypothetical protein